MKILTTPKEAICFGEKDETIKALWDEYEQSKQTWEDWAANILLANVELWGKDRVLGATRIFFLSHKDIFPEKIVFKPENIYEDGHVELLQFTRFPTLEPLAIVSFKSFGGLPVAKGIELHLDNIPLTTMRLYEVVLGLRLIPFTVPMGHTGHD